MEEPQRSELRLLSALSDLKLAKQKAPTKEGSY